MRNPDRIDPIMTALTELWKLHSDWRLYQLLYNIATRGIDPPIDLFYFEDDELLKELKRGQNIIVKEIILYNGIRITFRDMKYLYAFSTKCPICSKPIYKDDAIYSIMNNCTLFPSIAVHKECVNSKEKCVKQLISNYNQFKKMVKKYSFWQWNNGRNI